MWRDRALCKGLTDKFFPDPEDPGGEDPHGVVVVCQSCPVRAECAADGADEEFGIWGGTVPSQRGSDERR